MWRLVLHGTLVSLISFAVTCLAAALFPFVRREEYRASTAAPYEVLRVPLLSIAGFAFCGFAAFLVTRYVEYAGPTGELGRPDSVAFLVPLYLLAALLYVVSRGYRRSHEGVDIEVHYREVPARGAGSEAMGARSR